ncbi:cellular morphogenesis regulator DopA [Aspergillus melleus]|uniref:cellular morphogenesis regulator DopA n=1 Tax=Aspergillus melleus TaxID=138277 RepID=UPI001E8E109F|nr:Endosome to Golgi transport protein [Aspergillus melleus]KAH8427575.1 Endosome to Golgi transport protein [Aspergillus melleus]
MSLDPSSFPRSNSPASSESSLTRSRLRAKEEPLRKDKNYRRYASSVERALSLFDTTLQEWADYISFLSRLLKALQSHPPDLPIVPHKVLVAKRLAQCLNPSLPSGVHQKALEVYTYIFDLIKSDGLSQDLPLYLPGIAPTLTFASLTVRPLFLSLVETHVCGLEPWAIRPALKAIILALLPGLEEETSDDFEPTIRLVNKFRDISSQMDTNRPGVETTSSGQYFWQCLFLASITSPSRRSGVLAYLNRYLPKLGITDRRPSKTEASEDMPQDVLIAADSVVSPEPGLLIRCFASGLSDEQVLVQRNFLDLLVTHLPLSSPILQGRITDSDLRRLIIAAVGVVWRRDMSLNRRLWAWLMGPEPANDRPSFEGSSMTSERQTPAVGSQEISQSEYFSRFGLNPLIGGLLQMIEQDTRIPSEKTRPFRISLSLMDRWEVGGYIVPAVFLPIIRSVQAFESGAPKPQFDEVFRSASAFFDGVESGIIFSELLRLVDWKSGELSHNYDQILSNLKLAQFILENFNVREEDMVLTHVPLLTLSVLVKMRELPKEDVSSMTEDQLQLLANSLSRVMHALTGLITERAFSRKTTSDKGSNKSSTSQIDDSEALRKIHGFYDQSKGSLDLPPLPFAPKVLGGLIVSKAHELAISALDHHDVALPIHDRVNLLIVLLRKLPKARVLRDRRFYLAICNRANIDQTDPSISSFSSTSAIASAVTSLYSIHSPGYYVSYEDLTDLIPSLVKQLWQFLSPLNPKYHVEAVRCLWRLHSVSWPDHIVEAAITSLMIDSSSAASRHLSSEEQIGRYFVLWNHSHHGTYDPPPKHKNESVPPHLLFQSSILERPLFVVLDLLSQGPSEASHLVEQWLQDLSSIHKVFLILISRLEALFLRVDQSEADTEGLTISPDDYKEGNYLLETLHSSLSAVSHNGWVALLTHTPPQVEKHKDSRTSEDRAETESLHSTFFQHTLKVVSGKITSAEQTSLDEVKLQQSALLVMRQLLLGPGAESIVESGIDAFLVDRLLHVLDAGGNIAIQGALIDTLLAALKVRFAQAYLPPPPPRPKHQRASSRERLTSPSILSFTSDKAERPPAVSILPQPPPHLLDCILKGISSPKSREIVERWTVLLCEVLPLYTGSIFQILLLLVECFCKEIQLSYASLQLAFKQTIKWREDRSEHATIALLAGLETCIATAHERLLFEETNTPAAKSPDQTHSFFGNMVSGVFSSDAGHNRPSAANNRLTVLLCFQDAVRLCFSIWSWGAVERSTLPQDAESVASFQYTSLRMRNRSRRILEHLFTAEALECLETLVEMWTKSDPDTSSLIFSLIHTLDGSRPKITIPAVFNAIYTRTNPSALDPSRKSTLSSSLTEAELAGFLVAYAKSLDDDVLDEIWADCTTFLRDVLSNPFPHRQILPRLVEFAAILGAKLDNTSFGDDRRMRRELGDVLLRLLTAIFTSKPLGLSQESGLMSRASLDHDNSSVPHMGPDDMLSILSLSMPAFTTTLGDSDRINSAVSGISTNVIAPLLRSRLFPNNVNRSFMALLQHIAKAPAAAKIWKKDISDAFNDPRFFGSQVDLVKDGWMTLLRQWVLADKDRLSELMARLPPPSTAGIMFGVGASAARLDADRKAQLNLRRIALLILCANNDYFVGELPGLLQKLEDLLGATISSSPSSNTRAEIFMVFRALTLKTSTNTLAPFWPIINTELQEAIAAIPLGLHQEVYNPCSLLQACKLLDTLLVLAPDDFQLLEWLYVTDTIDAIYPPDRWESMALADEISQGIGVRASPSPRTPTNPDETDNDPKKPGLTADWIRETAKDEIIERVLRPWFDQLSIHAFESTYSMGSPSLEVCQDDLLADLFNESTMAN